jgi:hypothetical protein
MFVVVLLAINPRSAHLHSPQRITAVSECTESRCFRCTVLFFPVFRPRTSIKQCCAVARCAQLWHLFWGSSVAHETQETLPRDRGAIQQGVQGTDLTGCYVVEKRKTNMSVKAVISKAETGTVKEITSRSIIAVSKPGSNNRSCHRAACSLAWRPVGPCVA